MSTTEHNCIWHFTTWQFYVCLPQNIIVYDISLPDSFMYAYYRPWHFTTWQFCVCLFSYRICSLPSLSSCILFSPLPFVCSLSPPPSHIPLYPPLSFTLFSLHTHLSFLSPIPNSSLDTPPLPQSTKTKTLDFQTVKSHIKILLCEWNSPSWALFSHQSKHVWTAHFPQGHASSQSELPLQITIQGAVEKG